VSYALLRRRISLGEIYAIVAKVAITVNAWVNRDGIIFETLSSFYSRNIKTKVVQCARDVLCKNCVRYVAFTARGGSSR